MTTKNEATVLLLTSEDFDELTLAAGAVTSLLWRLNYRREIKIPLPKVTPKAATVLPLNPTGRAVGAIADLEDF